MTLLDDEIAEQPEAVGRFLEAQDAAVARIARDLRERGLRAMVVAARGSSDNAARYAQYLFGVQHRLAVGLAAPSLVTQYGTPPRLHGAVAVGISQSGRSPDIVAVLADAAAQGSPTVAITNDPDSPLGRAAEHVVDLRAGPERSVAATKTYSASLAALALLSAHLGDRPDLLAELRRVPAVLDRTLDRSREDVAALTATGALSAGLVIGRGFNYATAFEIALKIRELTGAGAAAYSSADVRHGPIASLGEQTPALLVAPTGAVLPDLRAMVAQLHARRSRVLAVTDDLELLAAADDRLPLPTGTPEWLSPLPAVIPGQLLAARLATESGTDVDTPLGLQKVTETH